MVRSAFAVALVALSLVLPVGAKVTRPLTPIEELARAEIVVLGKVTAIKKDMVTVATSVGATSQVAHQVTVVKVETALEGGVRRVARRVRAGLPVGHFNRTPIPLFRCQRTGRRAPRVPAAPVRPERTASG